MTPFGAKLRELRRTRGLEQKAMAEALGVSASYLSALENGRRGKPTWAMIQKVIGYFNVIWDEAEELEKLAAMSNPRVVVDTVGLEPEATAFANELAARIATLSPTQIADLQAVLDGSKTRP